MAQRRNRLHQARVSLLKTPWKARIAQENSHLARQQAILNRLIQEKMGQSKKQFGMHIATINSLSPLNVLARGYAIVQTLSDQEQPEKIVQEIKDVESDEQISIRLKDGRFLAKVQTTIPLDENLPFGQTK